MAISPIALQHLRTPTATKLPDGLKPGQIAFNLANKWLLVGCAGDDVLVRGQAVAAGSGTIFGVTNVVVPAKVATARPATGAVAGSMYQGEGYEIFNLEGEGLGSGPTLPVAANGSKGDLFVVVPAVGAPYLMLHNGSNWVSPTVPPKVFSATQAEITTAAGADITAKALVVIIAKTGSGITAKGDLHSGDILIVAGPGADAGSYVYDGSSFIKTGAAIPDATAPNAAGTGAVKGVVQLARDTDITETGDPAATTNNANGVVTAKQLRGLADQIAGLITGSTLLGTYDGSTSGIASLTSVAAANGRAGLVVAGKLSAGTGLKEGDFFVVSKAGTAVGDHARINGVLAANDHIVYVGGADVWHVISSPDRMKGVLVRDSSVAADGAANAYKLVQVLDLGEF